MAEVEQEVDLSFLRLPKEERATCDVARAPHASAFGVQKGGMMIPMSVGFEELFCP